MLYGTVLRAPVEGSVPNKIDDTKAKAVPGVTAVIRLPHGVGVVAETAWAALSRAPGTDRSVTWTRTGTAWGFDSDKGHDAFAADAKNLSQTGARLERARQCPWRIPECRKHGRRRISLRLCLSRADGAAERGRLGSSGRRCRRDLGRNAEPDHGYRGAGQVPRHFARQGEAARSADGRRFRSPRQSRCGFHHGRGDAVEGGRQPCQGDVDTRGRCAQRPLPATVGALPAGRVRCFRQAHGMASSRRGGPDHPVHGSGSLPSRVAARTAW